MIRRSYTANRVDQDGKLRGCLVAETTSWLSQPCKVLELMQKDLMEEYPGHKLVDFRRVK